MTAQKQIKVYKKGEIREAVLAAIGVSILLGGTFVMGPNFPLLFSTIVGLINEGREKKIPERKIQRVVKTLEKKKILFIENKGTDVFVHLKGHLYPPIVKYGVAKLLDFKKKNKKWRGKWYLVFFDIPEQERNKRDYLRRFLKKLGFFPYQQSVYVFPYECEEEIELIKKIVEGGKYISYVVAEKIEFEKKAKIFFELS